MLRTLVALARLLALSLALLVPLVRGQDEGLNDPTFNGARENDRFGYGANATVRAIAVQSDGKILLGGDFTSYNEESRSFLERVDSQGRRDLAYSGATALDAAVHAIALQSDGKAIIGGDFTIANGGRPRIARMRLDGFADTSFNIGTGANARVSAVLVQPDGKVVIAGAFTTFNGVLRNRIARLNADGSIDAAFNPGTGPNGDITSLALQPNGSILVGGSFLSWNNLNFQRVVRINALGGLDTAFSAASFNGGVLALALQPDGKVIVGGGFTTVDGLNRPRIARLLADGSLDTSFSSSSPNATVRSLALQADGKVLIGGDFTSLSIFGRARLARLNSNGGIDTSFLSNVGANGAVHAVKLDASGLVLIGGDFTEYGNTTRGRLARVLTSGGIDATFNPSGGANGIVYVVKAQLDGKLVIGGEFTHFNGVPRRGLARLNVDGSVDSGFNAGVGLAPSATISSCGVVDLLIEPSGKITVVGVFGSYDGIARNNILRLNADGSLDTSFQPGSGADDVLVSVDRLSDGRYVIGGLHNTYDGVARPDVTRLLANGAVDTTFGNTIGVTGGSVQAVKFESNGSVWIGGSFSTVGGVNCKSIAHLGPNGALDSTFVNTTGFGLANSATVDDIARQADGRILLVGAFSSYAGSARRGVLRILPSGALDSSFSPGTGAASGIADVVLLPDGKLLLGGGFESFDGQATDGIIRLLPNGSIDPTFNTQNSNTNAGVFSVDVLADGRVVLGGQFSMIHGERRHGVARLKIDTTKTYCVGKVNSAGCVPAIGTNGATPSYVNGGFVVTCTNALNQRSGLLFHGSTATAVPFQGGTLCVAQPVRRTVVQSSGGSVSGNDCSGTHAYGFTTAEFNAAALLPGDIVFCQWWMRDPASPSTTSLSNALRFSVML